MATSETIGRGDDVEVNPRRWWILLVLCLSLFMVVMGNTVLNIALPKMSEALRATGAELQWVVDAYALVFAGLLFTAGSLGDRFGRKGALMGGLVVFGLGSLSATFAESAGQVTAARAVMGLGAAFVMPATLSILTHVFPPDERAKAIGAWAGVAGAAGAVGPVTSGWLLEHFEWPAVFWLNVPVVLVALAAGAVLVPTSRHPDRVPLDPIGALLSIGMIGSLVYGVIEAPVYGWTDPLILSAFAVAAVLLAAFVVWELRHDHPMLDVRLFRKGGFTGGSLAIAMMFFGMFGMFFLLTQYLQLVRGYTPLEAGIRTLPFAVTMMVAAPSSAHLAARFGTRRVVTSGMAIAGTGMLVLAVTSKVDSSYLVLAACLVVLAGGMGLTMAPSTATIMASLPHEKAGVGSAMNDTNRELGGALGIAILGSVFSTVYAASVRDAAPGLPAGAVDDVASSLAEALRIGAGLGPDGGPVVTAARQAFVDGMGWALALGAGVILLGAVVVRLVIPAHPPAATDVVAVPVGSTRD
jgi:EmrB/QacA subfamily drug resistance transporter